ncbi:homogentisate 1,2-dioxygenase [Polytolypa hystricis UAMH7299]|uniref:homogentisate 1,2-dioxygenase n=1 Tax=Polytolypa hystricis (strain UAMH7299) TaxID=1447883 RepID=A0A2B7XTM0_POLH7|nr:homogentisate 1,2-dioxygenase [Polytolypa hystricis UAMH7299]
MMAGPGLKEWKPIKDLQKIFHYTDIHSCKPTRDDNPYQYLQRWGNSHQSEVIPNTLPVAQNNPKELCFGLYMEGTTYSAFVSPRVANFSVYLYCIRPAAAHNDYTKNVYINYAEKIDFVDELHTLAGSGDPNLREGIALYVCMINADMDYRAFCNTGGDFLLFAQLGNLNIQTEMVWESMWELPDLGPLGGHGLANPRDFLYPVAHIDDNLHEYWSIINKNNGKYNEISQDHSPFDIVAWHGNVVPYKYDLTKFASQNATSIDHTDPSVNCVLTAKSLGPNNPLTDFLWFGSRWDGARNSFRLPYFHRNSATEFLACLYGQGLGCSDEFLPGGGSVDVSHTPHGGFSEGYVHEMKIQVNEPRKILENQMIIMVETSRSLLLTEYARVGCGTFNS